VSSSQLPRPGASRLALHLESLQRFGIHPGLERVRALLAGAGNPQKNYPVVLVGGTNGKGSTCEFLAQSLAAEGRRVGLYTSPHLHFWNERIRVSGFGNAAGAPEKVRPNSGVLFPNPKPQTLNPIPDAELDILFDEAMPHLEAVAAEHGQPTEFETLTFLGLWHFSRVKVDIAIVEVGLGGKWDATNVCEPIVSVITHVALDHCDRLGNTLGEIARDKVCIARPGKVLVTAEGRDEVLEIFRHHCAQIGARLWPSDASVSSRFKGDEKTELHRCFAALEIFEEQFEEQKGGAPYFQVINARTAAVARWALQKELGWKIEVEPSPTEVSGRAEIVRENPLLILDGANNPDGAGYLAHYLHENYAGKNLILVCGISADKDWQSMIDLLAPLATTFIATQAQHPRAASAEVLAKYAREFCLQVEAIPSVPQAVNRALQLSSPGDVICVCGSFFVLGETDSAAIRDFQK